jgi:hypothetical protein
LCRHGSPTTACTLAPCTFRARSPPHPLRFGLRRIALNSRAGSCFVARVNQNWVVTPLMVMFCGMQVPGMRGARAPPERRSAGNGSLLSYSVLPLCVPLRRMRSSARVLCLCARERVLRAVCAALHDDPPRMSWRCRSLAGWSRFCRGGRGGQSHPGDRDATAHARCGHLHSFAPSLARRPLLRSAGYLIRANRGSFPSFLRFSFPLCVCTGLPVTRDTVGRLGFDPIPPLTTRLQAAVWCAPACICSLPSSLAQAAKGNSLVCCS